MMGVDPGADWAGSGLAYLTGASDGQPDFSRAAVLTEARRVAADIAQLLGVEVDAATMLAGRAAILGLTRGGRISAGGATRLLATADGWCAIALPRADDVAALPALLEVDVVPDDPWTRCSDWAATRSTEAVVARGQLLDIAVAGLGEVSAEPPAVRRLWCRRQTATRGRACWSPICRRCGPDRCARSCSLAPAPSSSRWKARTDPTAPAAASRPSSTG